MPLRCPVCHLEKEFYPSYPWKCIDCKNAYQVAWNQAFLETAREMRRRHPQEFGIVLRAILRNTLKEVLHDAS